jgi:hypothetical protein
VFQSAQDVQFGHLEVLLVVGLFEEAGPSFRRFLFLRFVGFLGSDGHGLGLHCSGLIVVGDVGGGFALSGLRGVALDFLNKIHI